MSLRQRVEQLWENGGKPQSISGHLLAASLSALSIPYGAAMQARSLAYAARILKTYSLSIPVISFGNLTVGGTGKTPLVMEAAQMLQNAGRNPAIVSRGYARRNPRQVLLLSNREKILAGPEEAGDEPFLLASNLPGIPVVVGSSRREAAVLAQNQCQADTILLDDGFQHQALARTCNIVLWDTTRPLGSLRLFPRGPMREGIHSLRRADALIFTRVNIGLPFRKILSRIKRIAPSLAVFSTGIAVHSLVLLHNPQTSLPPETLRNQSLAACCGIGNPASFWRLLEETGASLAHRHPFPDHHRPTRQEMENFTRQAQSAGAKCVVITEKDRQNVPSDWTPPLPVYVVKIRMEWGSELGRFQQFLLQHLDEESCGIRLWP